MTLLVPSMNALGESLPGACAASTISAYPNSVTSPGCRSPFAVAAVSSSGPGARTSNTAAAPARSQRASGGARSRPRAASPHVASAGHRSPSRTSAAVGSTAGKMNAAWPITGRYTGRGASGSLRAARRNSARSAGRRSRVRIRTGGTAHRTVSGWDCSAGDEITSTSPRRKRARSAAVRCPTRAARSDSAARTAAGSS